MEAKKQIFTARFDVFVQCRECGWEWAALRQLYTTETAQEMSKACVRHECEEPKEE